MEFFDIYKEMEDLERRVNMQIRCIQNLRLETSEGAYHPREQLEETGDMPTEELTEVNLSEEIR
jgi:hypothetical protein